MTIEADKTFVTHLLKRTSFNISRHKIEQLFKLDQATLLLQLVDKASNPVIPTPKLKNRENNTYPEFQAILKTELTRLQSTKSGLGDKMLWFWHGLLTSSYAKVNYPGLLWRQHQLLGKHALGSFRQLLIDICTDPAMLIYLDGADSLGTEPNENYARELMELFTMGRGNYTQNDVSAAAKALSGWYLTGLPEKRNQAYTPGKVRAKYDPQSGLAEDIVFLGKPGRPNITDIIDQILHQEATAIFIVTHLFKYFVHDQPSDAVLQELAAEFRQDYQLRPLLSKLFRHSEFTSPAALNSRPRLPLEWLCAALTTSGASLQKTNYADFLEASGQIPFDPPNVAGWTVGTRWLSAAPAMARTALAIRILEFSNRQAVIKNIAKATDPIAQTLTQLSLLEVSEQTRNQLLAATQQVTNRFDQARLLLTLALAAPEFALT
ncbi:MAG: DUF1800 family protein [Methylococcales bacterium]